VRKEAAWTARRNFDGPANAKKAGKPAADSQCIPAPATWKTGTKRPHSPHGHIASSLSRQLQLFYTAASSARLHTAGGQGAKERRASEEEEEEEDGYMGEAAGSTSLRRASISRRLHASTQQAIPHTVPVCTPHAHQSAAQATRQGHGA